MKKGQITIFIIIGIVLMLSFAAYFYISQRTSVEEVLRVPAQISPIHTFLEDCIKEHATNGLFLLGSQGGYIFPTVNTLETDIGTIAYGYHLGNSLLPSILTMKLELETYVDAVLPTCDLSPFENQGFTIEIENSTTKVTIQPASVLFEVHYPLKISKGQFTGKIDDFVINKPIRLGEMHSAAAEIVNQFIQDPDNVQVTLIGDLGFSPALYPIDQENLAVILTDETVRDNGEEFVFSFANRFLQNLGPTMDDLPDRIELEDGLEFVMKVNATDPDGDSFEFTDDTALFDITTDGWIRMTPEIPGEYNVTIIVTDENDDYDIEFVTFVVEE